MVLVGHNFKAFDAPLLSNELARLNPATLGRSVSEMFVFDTLPMARAMWSRTVLASKRQAAVYEFLFHEAPSDQHNALGDVRALLRVVQSPDVLRNLRQLNPRFVWRLAMHASDTTVLWPAHLVFRPSVPAD